MSRKYLRDRSLSLTKGDTEEQESKRLVESPEPEIRRPKVMGVFPSEPSSNPPGDYNSNAPDIIVHRPVLTQANVSPKFFNRDWKRKSTSDAGSPSSFKWNPKKLVYQTIPILSWLPQYKWDSVGFDAIAGFMIAVMNIPQGMAYAILGNLPPIVGIYMAFFPVIIYAILGTSRHVSMGTFAVICLMCGKTALDIQASFLEQGKKFSVLEISTALSLAVGSIQLLMGILRLGAVSRLLNAELVSGFTTGAAIHVFTSQVYGLLGLSVSKRSGLFKIILSYADFAQHIGTANLAAVIISCITITILTTYNELLKPIWSRHIKFPLPIELIAIVAGTLCSSWFDFNAIYNIKIVNTIPTGFPEPSVPSLEILKKVVFPDGLVIAFVAYAISISMAKIFASKHNYTIDANQELIAQGASNAFGSFFSCAPISASLSRSMVQEQVGGRTQLTSLFSCILLTFVLLWIGPFFETLPTCVLSAIIIVALKGLFLQASDFMKAWKISKVNAFIWMTTFVTTVVLDIEYGLGIGTAVSILVLIWRSNKPHMSILGNYADTDVYTDLDSGDQVHEIPGIKIVKYSGSLNFATAESFSQKVFLLAPLNADFEESSNRTGNKEVGVSTISSDKMAVNHAMHDKTCNRTIEIVKPIQWVILDASSLGSIDPEAAQALLLVYKTYSTGGMRLLLANCNPTVLEMLKTCKVIKELGCDKFFPSVHDAVACVSSTVKYSPQLSIRNSINAATSSTETESESEEANSYHRFGPKLEVQRGSV